MVRPEASVPEGFREMVTRSSLRKPVIVSMVLLSVIFRLPGALADDCRKAKEHFGQATAMQATPGDVQTLATMEALYRKALALCPDYAEAHSNLGDVYRNLGRYSEALAEYKVALSLDANLSGPCLGIAAIHYANGDHSEGDRWKAKALELATCRQQGSQSSQEPAASSSEVRCFPHLEILTKNEIVQLLGVPDMATMGGTGEVKVSFATEKDSAGIAHTKGCIPFNFDRFTIRDDARAQLDELGKAFNAELSVYVFEIRGHTDARGSDSYNLWQSQQRAQAAKNYLEKCFHIPDRALAAKRCGESRLLARGEDDASHARNRRVEIVRLGKTGSLAKSRATKEAWSSPAFHVEFSYLEAGSLQRRPIRADGSSILQAGKNPYQIMFNALQTCYAYVLQKNTSGRWYLLFPDNGSKSGDNPARPGKNYSLPGPETGFVLDEAKGRQTLFLIASL